MERMLLILGIALFAGVMPVALGATIDVTAAPFNATPDGGTDDAVPINAAIQAAQSGDTVFIPAGTFDISARVNAKSGVSLLGASAAATTLRYAGASSIQLLGLGGVTNVEVAHLTLDGNNSTKPTQGIYANGSSNLNLHDLAVKNLGIKTGFGPHAIFFEANVTNSVIANNTLSNIGTQSSWGAGVRLAHGSSGNQVIGNTISNTGRGGILCDNGSTDLLIRNNTVTGSGGTGLGIEIYGGCDRSIVEGNTIDHWLSVDGSHNLAIRRNTVSDFSGTYKYAGLELVDAHDVVFSDNVVNGGQKLGISISGPNPKERVLFTRNTIKTPSTWGVQIQGENGKAQKMYFHANTFQFAIRNGPATLYAPQGHGVRFNGDADHIVFDSNLIDSNQGQGVQLGGGDLDSLSFIRNTITNNALQAVTVSGVTNLVWMDNIVAGNGSDNQPLTLSALSGIDASAITVDEQIRVGEPVQFSIGRFPAQSELASFAAPLAEVLWDFGDGLPSTDFSPLHTFSAPGFYHVSMVGWDAAGNAIFDQATVSVAEVPESRGLVFALGGAVILWRARSWTLSREAN